MESKIREQAVLRRRIITSQHKQNAEETASKDQIRTNYKSASSMLLKLYACLIFFVLIIFFGAVYLLQPSLFSVVYRRYISPLKPSLRIRLLGHFPPNLSPRKDLPPIGGGIGMMGREQYAICTPENALTRQALHQIRDIQATLSSPAHQMKDMQWLVQEVPPSGLLLPYLKRQGCITRIESEWASTDTKFLQLPRPLQVDWAQWCALTVASSLAADKTEETAIALGMLNFDALRDWDFVQPLSPLLKTAITATMDKSFKEYRHSNLIFLEEAPRQISTSLLVFLAGFDASSPSKISKQVVKEWMQPLLLKSMAMNYNQEQASALFSTFLYDLLEPQFSVNKKNWVVGRIAVSKNEEPPLLIATDDTEEIILAQRCADRGDGMRSCQFMVVPQEKRKGNRLEETQELRRQL